MSVFLFFYGNNYQIIKLNQNKTETFTVGSEIDRTVTIRQFPFTKGFLTITEDAVGYKIRQGDQLLGNLEANRPFELVDGNRSLTILHPRSNGESADYYVGDREEIVVSNTSATADIFKVEHCYGGKDTLHFSLLKLEEEWVIFPADSSVYVNGKKIGGKRKIEVGDWIFTPCLHLRFVEEDVLQVISYEQYETSLLPVKVPYSEMKKKYPVYRRTPRMLYELPKEKVTLSFPAQEHEMSNRGLWLIIMPPLVMLMVMGAVAIIQPRGIFIIVSMVMFMMTLITSSVQYFKDRKRHKEREEKRVRVYRKYLEDKREELQSLADEQKFALDFHFPAFERMKYLTSEISDRIWERSLTSRDFLQFRLGTGSMPASYTVTLNSNDMANRELDELIEKSQQLEKLYKEVKDVPIVVDFSVGPIGLIGKERVVKDEIHQIVGQLAFSHSYHDVRFVFIFDENDYEEFEWMKWLPHFVLPNRHARGFIYNETTRDQLLTSIYEMIRERDLMEKEENLIFTPHIVFIVTNPTLIADHVILEYLEGDYANIGISVMFATDAKESLSDNIHTLVRYISDTEGDILLRNQRTVDIPFKLDEHSRKGNEDFARMLRTLHHQVGMSNSIPTSVTFLEMMNVSQVEELPIYENWVSNESAKSLAVPIGLKGKDDFVHLNLHEKAHGPHGLLAGTTGSGKSEFLQTYILSLAVHFHPHEVAFLLIDYKGGGMAKPFKKLPHLLGTITNIESSVNFTNRALASIRSELKQRQRLFDQYEVSHIDDYTTLYKQQIAKEPLPHLFLISDEFAELKNEEPEFIRELVSAARIGRSLGVHLILATQKPGGIIDDQIWSNSRFKVALKVQDANDSKEILKNADAAAITVTGRGYLQVGNNEVYELFQSAWSGAPYLTEHADGENEIALVTDLGLVPLSNVSTNEPSRKNRVMEIDAIVEQIAVHHEEHAIPMLKSPWLPPLAERIRREDYPSPSPELIPLAVVDEPEKQSQAPYYYRLMDDGNIGIFGAVGYGKSYTALTILLGIAEHYTPEEVHYYLLDFGNGSLLPLKQLPHVADFFTMEDTRKIEKLMNFLREEIKRRKQLLQEYEVSNIKLYNRISKERLPVLFIVLENFDFVKEEMQDIEQFFNQFVRDGQSLGIYMIFTATRISTVRQAVMNNLKTKVVHYLFDQSEAYAVLGKTTLKPEPIPGRAIIKTDEAAFAQVFLPVDGATDFDVIEGIKEQVQAMKERYKAAMLPSPIPMLPAQLTAESFKEYIKQTGKSKAIFPIGLEEEFVQPISVNLQSQRHCLILGQAQKGKTNILKNMLRTALEYGIEDIAVHDSIEGGLANIASGAAVMLEVKEQIADWLTTIEGKLASREQQYMAMDAMERAGHSFDPILLIIDDYPRFLAKLDNSLQDRISKFMKNYSHLGFSMIVAGNSSEVTKGYDALTGEIKQIRQAILLVKKSDQTLFTLPYERKEDEVMTGFGYYVLNGNAVKIQIPLCEIERRIYT